MYIGSFIYRCHRNLLVPLMRWRVKSYVSVRYSIYVLVYRHLYLGIHRRGKRRQRNYQVMRYHNRTDEGIILWTGDTVATYLNSEMTNYLGHIKKRKSGMLDSSIPVPTNASDKCAGTNRTDTGASGLRLQFKSQLTMPRFFLLGWFSTSILLW